MPENLRNPQNRNNNSITRIAARLSFRYKALRFCVRGDISLFQFLCQMVPRSMRPDKDTEVSLLGKPFILPFRDIGEFIDLVEQIVDKNQYRAELIGNDSVVVDAGANIGIFSILAATHTKAAVYAFEPTPYTFRILQENAKPYPNIKAFNCG